MNLLLNAAEAMSGVDDRLRELLIRTERDPENRVRVSVRDSGVGLEGQGLDRLFRRVLHHQECRYGDRPVDQSLHY